MERSSDRIRPSVTTPTEKIMRKLARGQTITPEERTHALRYVRGRILDEPATLRWRMLLTDLIQVRAK